MVEIPPIRLISESEFGLGRTEPMAKPTARRRQQFTRPHRHLGRFLGHATTVAMTILR